MKNLTIIATCWSHVYSDLEKHKLPDSSRINLNFRFMICLTQAQTGTQSCYIKAGYTHRDFSDLKRFFFNLWQNPHIKIKSYLTVLVELLAQIISIESSYVITRALLKHEDHQALPGMSRLSAVWRTHKKDSVGHLLTKNCKSDMEKQI